MDINKLPAGVSSKGEQSSEPASASDPVLKKYLSLFVDPDPKIELWERIVGGAALPLAPAIFLAGCEGNADGGSNKKINSLALEAGRGSYTALQELASMGKPAVPMLTQMAYNNHFEAVRKNAAIALIKMGEAPLPILVDALSNFDPTIVSAATQALTKMGQPAIPALIEALNPPAFPRTRVQAAKILGDMKAEQAVLALVKTLGDKTDGVDYISSSASRALIQIGPPAIPNLINVIKDKYELETLRTNAQTTLENMGKSAVPALLEILKKDTDMFVSAAVVNALGKIKDAQAVPALIAALGNPSYSGHHRIAKALGEIGDRRAVLALLEAAVKEEQPAVREEAIIALGKLGDERAIPVLIEALGDKGGNASGDARHALKKMGTPAVPGLIAALKDKRSEVRENASWVLGEIGDPSAIPALTEAYGKDQVVSMGVDLSKIKDQQKAQQEAHTSVPRLLEKLKYKDQYIRDIAITELKDMGKSAVPYLINALKDSNEYLRASAAEALGEIKDEQARDALVEATYDSSPMVREKATRAFNNIYPRK